MKSIETREKNLVAIVDYRTELLGIIMWLNDYHTLLPECFRIYENKFYIDNILEKFLKFSDEEVVNDFISLVEKHKLMHDAPYALFLQLDEHFKCEKLDDYVFKERLDEDTSVYDFIEKLEEFAKKINFEEYYNNNIVMYKKWTNYILECFKKGNVLNFYDDYFGKANNEFYLNLIPFASDGSFSASIYNKIYDMNPFTGDMKKESLFERNRYENVISAPIHEFLHGYVNPITEKYALLDFNTNLFENLKGEMSKHGYPTDVEIINEHIVKAIQIRYILKEYKDIKWAKYVTDEEEKNGFIYIRNMLTKLEEFESNRDKYRDFEKFYPEIIKDLKSKILAEVIHHDTYPHKSL